MPPSVVGLVAAVGAAMSVIASSAHGDLFWAVVVDAVTATGLAAYLALPPTKKRPIASRLQALLCNLQQLSVLYLPGYRSSPCTVSPSLAVVHDQNQATVPANGTGGGERAGC
jgi:hypothetical protein